jgi:hypothetical protein
MPPTARPRPGRSLLVCRRSQPGAGFGASKARPPRPAVESDGLPDDYLVELRLHPRGVEQRGPPRHAFSIAAWTASSTDSLEWQISRGKADREVVVLAEEVDELLLNLGQRVPPAPGLFHGHLDGTLHGCRGMAGEAGQPYEPQCPAKKSSAAAADRSIID